MEAREVGSATPSADPPGARPSPARRGSGARVAACALAAGLAGWLQLGCPSPGAPGETGPAALPRPVEELRGVEVPFRIALPAGGWTLVGDQPDVPALRAWTEGFLLRSDAWQASVKVATQRNPAGVRLGGEGYRSLAHNRGNELAHVVPPLRIELVDRRLEPATGSEWVVFEVHEASSSTGGFRSSAIRGWGRWVVRVETTAPEPCPPEVWRELRRIASEVEFLLEDWP